MLIYILILLSVIVVVKSKKAPEKKDGLCAADIKGIMDFLHGFNSLCSGHEIISTDVLISWVKTEHGYEITAFTKIFKIDGENAADAVDMLRRRISYIRNDIRTKNPDADSAEIYKLQSEAEDRAVLNFFDTDHLKGIFFDITDCEYVDDERYIEFEDLCTVVRDSLNQSLSETLDAVCTQTTEQYNYARTDRQKDMIKISFN